MEHITSYMIRARNNCIYMTSRKFILFQLLRAGAQCYCMMIPSTYYSQRRTNDNLALHSTLSFGDCNACMNSPGHFADIIDKLQIHIFQNYTSICTVAFLCFVSLQDFIAI